MDNISQLWSTYPIVIVAIAVAIVVVCCCCCCYITNHTPGKSTYHGNRVTPSNLESGSLKRLIKLPTNRRTKGDYELLNGSESETDLPEKYPAPTANGNQERPESEINVPEEYPNLPTPTVSVSQERPVTHLPHRFSDFIIKIIPYFLGQRKRAYQFAVVVLLSENDFDNIYQTSFTPSRSDSGKPIVDNDYISMPRDRTEYGNYIVARPFSNSYHSEEEIFGQHSVTDSPFSHLWSAYMKHSGAIPKCVLIYSWNLPCTRCTDVIIRSLREEPYNRVGVIVAHTQLWLSEILNENKNRENLTRNNITVQQVGYPARISPASD